MAVVDHHHVFAGVTVVAFATDVTGATAAPPRQVEVEVKTTSASLQRWESTSRNTFSTEPEPEPFEPCVFEFPVFPDFPYR